MGELSYTAHLRHKQADKANERLRVVLCNAAIKDKFKVDPAKWKSWNDVPDAQRSEFSIHTPKWNFQLTARADQEGVPLLLHLPRSRRQETSLCLVARLEDWGGASACDVVATQANSGETETREEP